MCFAGNWRKSRRFVGTNNLFGAKQVEVFLLFGTVLSDLVKILEQRILPDRFRSALPADELELRDALIGL